VVAAFSGLEDEDEDETTNDGMNVAFSSGCLGPGGRYRAGVSARPASAIVRCGRHGAKLAGRPASALNETTSFRAASRRRMRSLVRRSRSLSQRSLVIQRMA